MKFEQLEDYANASDVIFDSPTAENLVSCTSPAISVDRFRCMAIVRLRDSRLRNANGRDHNYWRSIIDDILDHEWTRLVVACYLTHLHPRCFFQNRVASVCKGDVRTSQLLLGEGEGIGNLILVCRYHLDEDIGIEDFLRGVRHPLFTSDVGG